MFFFEPAAAGAASWGRARMVAASEKRRADVNNIVNWFESISRYGSLAWEVTASKSGAVQLDIRQG
jgi:hypothetical protein